MSKKTSLIKLEGDTQLHLIRYQIYLSKNYYNKVITPYPIIDHVSRINHKS